LSEIDQKKKKKEKTLRKNYRYAARQSVELGRIPPIRKEKGALRLPYLKKNSITGFLAKKEDGG